MSPPPPQTPLSILYVGTLPPHPGGSALSCSQIVLGLAGLGHRVRCIAAMTPDATEFGDSFAVASPQLEIRRYRMPYFEIQPHQAPASYFSLEAERIEPELSALVAEERPDVVFAGRESFAWNVPRLAAARRLPCMVRFSGSGWLPILQGRHGRGLAQALLREVRRATGIVTSAHFLARGLRDLGLAPVSVVPNPVDLERFRPRERDSELARAVGIDDGDLVLVHASNLKALKRPLDIVHSAERVLAEEPRALYVIVGDGPCRAETEAASEAAGVSSRFRFVGWVDYDRMPGYLSLADIVVMPSEAEAQSRACLETQASGRALLASDIPGAREIVVDGETGVLFEPGNIDDLTAKTLLLARQPDLRRRIGKRARQLISPHSLAEVVRGYDAVLQELVRGGAYELGATSA